MRTSPLHPATDSVVFSRPACQSAPTVPQSGFVSELGYGAQQPLLSLLLPPLLRQLGSSPAGSCGSPPSTNPASAGCPPAAFRFIK
ncbi:SulA-like leucine-rich domain-containing protein [Edwardsiella piscicida]|nr:SulA-like leucine-rich domain-containing protein [Edwardsiella piscicida]